jgi:hypothetical protein
MLDPLAVSLSIKHLEVHADCGDVILKIRLPFLHGHFRTEQQRALRDVVVVVLCLPLHKQRSWHCVR